MEKKAIRLAFLGCGYNLQHMNVIKDFSGVKIVGVYSRDIKNAKAVTEKFGGNAYDDYKKMLEVEKIDAAYVCFPPHAHGLVETECIKRKIHLFIEKPVALDMLIAEDIMKKAEEKNVFLFAAYKFRYSLLVQKLRTILKKEQTSFFDGYFNMPEVVKKEWWQRKDMSGGQIVEQATHIVDLIRLFFGEIQDKNIVTAKIRYKELDIPDSSAMLLKTDSGVIGCMHTSFATPVLEAGFKIITGTKEISLLVCPGIKLIIKEKGKEFILQEDENLCLINESKVFLDAVKMKNNVRIKDSYKEAILTLKATL
ncbi:MAG: Gfo/Idh/MocA family oxidoreductase [Candidatus Firestonebacteria bacterium]